MRICSLSCRTVRVPLSQPLQLGSLVLHAREYILVEVATDSGVVGRSWGMTRDLPVAQAVIDLIAPHAIGRPASATRAVWNAALDSNRVSGRAGIAMRALSLVDIALWDLNGIAQAKPLYELLGGEQRAVDLIAVTGYPGTGATPAQVGDRLASLTASGHALVKIARWPDPADTTAILGHAAGAGCPDRSVVVDAAWIWDDPHAAATEIEGWGSTPLAWVEDPFPGQLRVAYRRLAARCAQPLAAGDEMTDSHLLCELAAGVPLDVVRLDATVAGGLTGAQQMLGWCAYQGLPVSLHVHAPLHAHLAAAFPTCGWIEAFLDEDRELDPIHRLFGRAPVAQDGRLAPLTGPGHGCELDWEFIERHTAASWQVGPEQQR